MRTCRATFHVNIAEQSRREDARSVEVDPVEVIRDWLNPCERDDRERQSWISWRALWLTTFLFRAHDISSSETYGSPITKSRTFMLLTNRGRDSRESIGRKPRVSIENS